MEMSIKEKMQALEAKVSDSDKELVALRSVCEDYKVENEAIKAELMEAKADVEGMAVAHAEAMEELKDELEAKDEELVDANESIEQMKANMELSPAAEVIEGADPVADGSVADADPVDHVVEMNKIEDSAKRIAYYRSHKEEIDKA
jgi:predicted RNase H-like nuclease (RuvC/YqgF family)